MEILNNTYVQALIVLIIVAIVTVFTKVLLPKIKVYLAAKGIVLSKEDVQYIEKILDTVEIIADKLGYKTKNLQEVTEIVYEAVNYIESVEKIEDTEILMDLIIDKTKEIMLDEGIVIDGEIELIIEEVIKLVVTNMDK